MLPIETLSAFIVASAFLSLAPGPDNIFVLMQSALYGPKSGLAVTVGLCTGLIVHTTAVAIGVAAIFQTSVLAFTVLKMLGAAYLVFLAWQAFKASGVELESQGSEPVSLVSLYRRGILMNITNPKVSIFFLAFLPQFASLGYGDIAPQVFLLGAVFMLTALCIFTAIAFGAGAIGTWFQQSPKASVYLNRIAGAVFVALAVKLINTSNMP